MEHEAIHHTKHHNSSILYYVSLVLILMSLVLLILSYYQMQPLIWTPKIQFPNLRVQPSPTPEQSINRDVLTPRSIQMQADINQVLKEVSQIDPQLLLPHINAIQKEAASFTH